MPPAAPARHPNQVLAVLLLAGVAFALSQTMVVPALPALAADLHASTSAASWLLTGYLLSASVATPIAGKLGDLFGKGRVLTGVLLVFSAGSAICALGNSIEVVIAGRVVQGVAGGVFPLSFGIIRDTFAAENHSAESDEIQIITQPGVGPLRGAATSRVRDGALSGKSPFTTEKGPERTQNYQGNLGGTVIPQWISVVGLVIGAGMALMLWREARR